MSSQRPFVYMFRNPSSYPMKGAIVRKLILRMLTSIDGFIADPKGDLRFGSHWSEQMQQFYAETFAAAGGLVYGRTVYEKYVPYWESVAATGRHPHSTATDAEVTYAKRVRELPKYVASTTLAGAAANTTVLRPDPAGQVAELKRQPGGDLLLMCGPALLADLSAHNLVDEYMLDVYPIAVGRGIHLWRDVPEPIGLRLVRSQPYPDDVTLQIYAPQEAPTGV